MILDVNRKLESILVLSRLVGFALYDNLSRLAENGKSRGRDVRGSA